PESRKFLVATLVAMGFNLWVRPFDRIISGRTNIIRIDFENTLAERTPRLPHYEAITVPHRVYFGRHRNYGGHSTIRFHSQFTASAAFRPEDPVFPLLYDLRR